jgi:hypothetical protein
LLLLKDLTSSAKVNVVNQLSWLKHHLAGTAEEEPEGRLPSAYYELEHNQHLQHNPEGSKKGPRECI